MSSSKGIPIIMGGAGIFRAKPANEVPSLLDCLTKHKVDKIDTAIIYGDSEEVIGIYKAGDTFVLDTKIPGGMRPGSSGKDEVVKMGNESLDRLKVKQVDVLYVHGPDPKVPFEQTFDGLNELYKQGMFRRLGLSNFKVEQVQEIHDICEKNGWVKPTVFQGNYNAFARSYESGLLQTLRKLGISFFAYSPQAGGFLSKTSELVNQGKGEGRMSAEGPIGDLYRTLYKKPTLMEGLTKWNDIASEANLKPGDMAVRWVRYNSALKNEHGDAIIVGGRTIEQVDQTLTVLEQGPLDESVVKKIDEVWETVKNDAPVDNYHDFVAKMS